MSKKWENKWLYFFDFSQFYKLEYEFKIKSKLECCSVLAVHYFAWFKIECKLMQGHFYKKRAVLEGIFTNHSLKQPLLCAKDSEIQHLVMLECVPCSLTHKTDIYLLLNKLETYPTFAKSELLPLT